MIICSNGECENCYKDHLGNLVCESPSGTVIGRHSNDMHPNILRCLSFRKRATKVVPELYPGMGLDGLFEGQIKPKETQ